MEITNIHGVKLKMSCYNRDKDRFWRGLLSQCTRACANSMSNPSGYTLGIWLPVSHAPSCIGTTNPSRTGLNPLNKVHAADPASQTLIEKPRLWLLARSGCSIQEQALYSKFKLDDLKKSLDKPTISKSGPRCQFVARFDYPAQAFETAWQLQSPGSSSKELAGLNFKMHFKMWHYYYWEEEESSIMSSWSGPPME